jgi:hypothetical protein
MNTTKKVILGCAFAVTLVSGYANAAGEINVASTVAAAGAEPVATPVASGSYNQLVKSQFVFTRSRNVAISSIANDAGTGIAISTASIKGRNGFFANSNGQSPKPCKSQLATGAAFPTALVVTAQDVDLYPTGCAY